MWSTLDTVLRPASLAQARELACLPGHALVGGGSYLADRRPAGIHTLVAIAPLLDTRRQPTERGWLIGAGNSLEGLRRWALDHGVPALAEALAADTPEPNLRHQRLLGGALVLGRGLSPLGALCLAADARLVTVEARAGLPISGWQGPGLITGLELPAAPLAFAGLGLLPASRPIVFAAAARLESGTRIVVGSAGGCLTPGEWPEGAVRPLANHATDLAAALRDDPQGSAAWKTRCLAALLQDLEDRLWT